MDEQILSSSKKFLWLKYVCIIYGQNKIFEEHKFHLLKYLMKLAHTPFETDRCRTTCGLPTPISEVGDFIGYQRATLPVPDRSDPS